MAIKKIVLEVVKTLINESTKVNFKGHSFVLRVGVNEDPNKMGIKVQFIPTTFGTIAQTEQNDLAIELEEKLEQGLSEYGIKVERDRNLKDKTIIGFFIYIEYIDRIIRKVLQDTGKDASKD